MVEPRMDPIAAVGQHMRAILAELGFDEAFAVRLDREKAISAAAWLSARA